MKRPWVGNKYYSFLNYEERFVDKIDRKNKNEKTKKNMVLSKVRMERSG